MSSRLSSLAVEARFESADLLLEAIHSGFQLDNLGTRSHRVEFLLDTVRAIFNALRAGRAASWVDYTAS